MSLVVQILALFTFFWSFGWGAVDFWSSFFEKKSLSLESSKMASFWGLECKSFQDRPPIVWKSWKSSFFGGDGVLLHILRFFKILQMFCEQFKNSKNHGNLGFGTFVIFWSKMLGKYAKLVLSVIFWSFGWGAVELEAHFFKNIFVAGTFQKWRRFRD